MRRGPRPATEEIRQRQALFNRDLDAAQAEDRPYMPRGKFVPMDTRIQWRPSGAASAPPSQAIVPASAPMRASSSGEVVPVSTALPSVAGFPGDAPRMARPVGTAARP
jgi:hypothetical protein